MPATSAPVPPPSPPPPPRQLSEIVRPRATPAYLRAGQALLEALGGEEAVIDALSVLDDSKAIALVEQINDRNGERAKMTFYERLAASGLRQESFLKLYNEGRKLRALARIGADMDEVLLGVAERAKDKLVRCGACAATGWTLDEDGAPTAIPCFPCHGTSWVLKNAEPESVELYLKLLKLHADGPAFVLDQSKQIDARSLAINSNVGGLPAGAPDIHQIIKRADQQVITVDRQLPAADSALPDPMLPPGAGRSTMPEDLVIEAEEVGP